VYPTSAAFGTSDFCRRARSRVRRSRNGLDRAEIVAMRRLIRRGRSRASFSPGPLVPMPPPSATTPCLGRSAAQQVLKLASSTAIAYPRPARLAKMSRIELRRSINAQRSAASRCRTWVGVSSWSQTTGRCAVRRTPPRAPGACRSRGRCRSGARSWIHPERRRPPARHEAAEFFERLLGFVPARLAGRESIRATRSWEVRVSHQRLLARQAF